ncbi:MAG: delta-class carbonic anhydrase [Oceanicaulis sp.]
MKYAVSTSVLAAVLLAACSGPAEDAEAPAEDAAPAEEVMSEDAAPASGEANTPEEAMMASAPICEGFGPQTPRDIANREGTNPVEFPLAPAPSELNLCNIHTHTNAEHKAPGFSVFVGDSDDGGYACNETESLTEAELTDPANGEGAFGGVAPGDTIEVHWVFSSCDVAPGEGLGSCLAEGCENPLLRVEAQSFLVVNDPENALDFTQFDYAGSANEAGLHQPRALPTGSGDPVLFRGSTTGPSYDQQTCSPLQVTWNVRPQCQKVDISSLHRWAAEGNAFNETESHGVRQLVTAPELLSPIEGE